MCLYTQSSNCLLYFVSRLVFSFWFSLCCCSYFAQILEEHGPLMAEDTLLVGELKYFPPVAQQKIQDAGSFESFLLESLRFIKMGRCIGLAKHAVSLQQAGHGAILDDLDIIVDPDTNNVSTDLHEAVFPRYGANSSSAQTQVHPVLPNPYTFSTKSAYEVVPYQDSFYRWSSRDSQQPSPYPFDRSELDHVSDSDVGVLDIDPYLGGVASWTSVENLFRKHQAVQVNVNILIRCLNKARWNTWMLNC